MGAPKHRWTPEQDSALRALNGQYTIKVIGRRLGLAEDIIFRRQKKLGLVARSTREILQPPDSLWVAVATEAAKRHRIKPSYLLAGARAHRVSRARHEAWATFVAQHPEYSIAGLARTSGFNHTSVLAGIKRVAARAGIPLWAVRVSGWRLSVLGASNPHG